LIENPVSAIRASGLSFDVGHATDLGCRRDNNEDFYGIDPEKNVFVVCDGMGGAAAGEVASQLAVEGFLAAFANNGDGDLAGMLQNAVRQANESIRNAKQSHPEWQSMGCTLVAAWVQDRVALVANVGDSRAYLIAAGHILQITRDHSLVAFEVEQGLITPEEAETSPHQSVITRALGMEPPPDADLFSLELEYGQSLLLTTDGLTRHVPEDTIRQMVETNSPQDAASGLVKLARLAGGSDNITCVVVRPLNGGAWL
jgi:PPM family protein phosphatase